MSAPDCAICLDQLYGNDQEVAVVTSCGHSFHSPCIFQAHNRDPRCPMCRWPIPDRGSIARITFQGGQELENEEFEVNSGQDDEVFSEENDDDSMESEDSEDEDPPSDQERSFNDLSRAFAEQAIQLRRVQEEKDEMSRKLIQKKRKIRDLEARIRALKMQSNSTRGNGRSQPSNTWLQPARPSSYSIMNFDGRYQL